MFQLTFALSDPISNCSTIDLAKALVSSRFESPIPECVSRSKARSNVPVGGHSTKFSYYLPCFKSFNMLKYKNVVSTTFWFLRRLLKIEFVIWSRAKFRVSLQACQISRFAAQIVNERVKIVKSQVLVRGEKIRNFANFEFFMGTYRLYTRSCPWCPSTDQTPRKCGFQLRIRWCLN